MTESINDNDLLSYINEELITNNYEKDELNEELYSKYLKTDSIGKNSTININEKNKLDLAQATLLNSLTNNVYNQVLPLSPPQDDINSPSNEMYLNSQSVQNVPSNSLNSPSMELEALSPSSMGSEINDVSMKTEEQNLMNLTQIYQNNGLLSADDLINQELLSQYTSNPDLINNNVLLNAMCTDETNKSQLFPQVQPNTNISIPSTYINDTLNPLSTVNISLPTDTNIPVTLNTVMSLPTVTVPSNMEFTVPSNTLNLNSDLATSTADLDLTTLQSLSPLALSGPLAVANTNSTPIIPSTIIGSISTSAPSAAAVDETKASSFDAISNSTSNILTTAIPSSTVSTSSPLSTITNPPLSATLDLTSLKTSVNETLQLTKKLSQGNSSTTITEERKPNVIDVTDILKSDVAASCLNLLKGSKGKPGRKKKCIQNSSSDNTNSTNTNISSTTTTTNITSSTTSATSSDNKFPYLKLMNQSNEGIANTNANNLTTNSVKFPIIKPKISATQTSDNHTPILPLAPATTKSNSINCFNGTLLAKAPTPGAKQLNSTLLHPPILPNGSTEKNNTNNNNNQVKTAYQKRQERLLKNREAAHLSRKRKREQLHMLETHAQELIAENQTLKLKVIELEQLNEKLLKENQLLKMNNKSNDVNLKMNVKKEFNDINELTDISDVNVNAMSSDIYNLYIKSDVLNGSNNTSIAQNKSSAKSKEIGIVFMVILFSFSLFTFPLSIFTGKGIHEINNNSLISSFMNKLNDFSLASISSDNTGKVLSSGYEQEKPFLLDSGHYELPDTQSIHGELEVRSMDRKRNEKGQLSQYKKSRKMKNSNSNTKSKQKRNTTRRNIKKNYEYTTYNEISSLMNVFHPNNVELDEDSLKQMSLLQHWIVEGFCSVHENHTYAKDSSNVKDIIKVYNNEDINESSTDLTVKKNSNNNYYDSSKRFTKEIPWNIKQFIKIYPDTTYFYSPKLVQLFPLSTNDILEPSISVINRLQPNNTVEAEANEKDKKENIVSPSSHYSSDSYYNKKNNNDRMEENNKHHNDSSSKSENQDNDNVYHLPFTNKSKMAIITNIESDDIDEDSNSYLMIDFEIKGARLIESE